MIFKNLKFGEIEIDGIKYTKDIIIERGKIILRDKSPSKIYTAEFGHTPLSIKEYIPWNCKTLIIGTGIYGSMPVMSEVIDEAKDRGVELLMLRTPDAVEKLKLHPPDTNAILHLTC